MATRPGLREAVVAFRHRNFSLFWFGALLSNTGTWVQNVTVPYVVFQLTRDPLWVGIAAFAQLAPMAVCSMLGGALADRFQRRRVLLVTQSAAAAVAVGLWVLWVSGSASVPGVIALVALGGVVAGLNIPSWQAFVTELVPRETLLNAVTLNSAQFNAARAFGPAVGGLVIARYGVGWAFLINALSFAAVLGALAAIRVPLLVRESAVVGVVAGMVAAARDGWRAPGIRTCLIAVVALGLAGMPIMSLLVVFAEQEFGVDGFRYGLLAAAMGLGSVLATPLVAGPGSGMTRSRLAGSSMALYGGALVAFALSPSYALGLAMLVLAGAAYLPVAATLNTSLQMQVSERQRGRTVALYVTALTVAVPIGTLTQAGLASLVGVRPVVVGAGAVYLGVVALLVSSGLLERLDDSPAEPEPEGHPMDASNQPQPPGTAAPDGQRS